MLKKIKNNKLFAAVIIMSAILGLAGITIAVAPLARTIKNAFFPSEISIDLLEPKYDSAYVTSSGDRMTVTVVPYQKIDKDPQIKNTCLKDEIVFMKVKVPLAEVRTLTSTKTGLETNAYKEVYLLESDDESKVTVSSELSGKTDATADDIANGVNNGKYWKGWENGDGKITISQAPESQISHHSDWVLISNKINYKGVKPISREYIFGYKKIVSPNNLTSTLFDKMSLVHFTDQDAKGELNDAESRIDINAYAIQSDNVELDGGTKLSSKMEGDTIITDVYDTLYTLYKMYGEEAVVS